MPKATYKLELELAYNTWTDVTADWFIDVPLVITRGIEPGHVIAGPGLITFSLYSPDGRYVPGHASVTTGFDVGIGMRLSADDGSGSYPLFYGRVAAITPRRETGTTCHPDRVDIIGEDEMAALRRLRLETFPLLTGVTPGELVWRLVEYGFTPPGLFDYWRLGQVGAAELGQVTVIAGSAPGVDYDTGQSVFPWAGDRWASHRPIIYALEDVCISEGGYFYVAADGTPVFDDRHARPKHITPDGSLSANLRGLAVAWQSERIANQVALTLYPREVGSAGSVLWASKTTIKIRAGMPRVVVARYVDPAQEAARVGAKDVVTPVAGTDFVANTRPDGSGINVTGHIIIEPEIGASSARLKITHSWPGGSVYLTTLQLRGTPLRSFHPAVIVVEDEDSFLSYGLRTLHLDLPLQGDASVAGDMALAMLHHRKDPHPWLDVMVEATASSALLTHALARDVGDRLDITESDLALDAVGCFIEHIRHEIARGGASHRVTWRTTPAGLGIYWMLGETGASELGQVTWLGY